MEFLDIFTNPNFWYGVIRGTTPILLVALAALLASRCGITNMALEGTMLFAALFAVIGSWMTQNVMVGILSAMFTGVVFSLFLAFFKLKLKANEIMAALAINLFSTGTTVFILYLMTGNKGSSAALNSPTIPVWNIPFIKDIPFLGAVISGHSMLVYVSLLITYAAHYLLFKTPLGLRIRSVGSNEDAAESVGVSVNRTRYIAMGISGVLVGLAGAFMSMSYMSMFTANMTSGRGFIGLAASNVGGRTPIGAFLAALLFGFFDSLGNNLQRFAIPAELIFMIPYIATIVMYTYYSARSMNRKKRMAKKILESEE